MRGSIQLALRWKTESRAVCGAICGMIWTALAPLPMTATFSPERSCAWFQRAEWKDVPWKSASPGMSGW